MFIFWLLITIANGYYAITLWPTLSGAISAAFCIYGLWAISKRLTTSAPKLEK